MGKYGPRSFVRNEGSEVRTNDRGPYFPIRTAEKGNNGFITGSKYPPTGRGISFDCLSGPYGEIRTANSKGKYYRIFLPR